MSIVAFKAKKDYNYKEIKTQVDKLAFLNNPFRPV
jgi:hypothetical protein